MNTASTCVGECHCHEKAVVSQAAAQSADHHEHTHKTAREYLWQYRWLGVTLGVVFVFAIVATVITSLEPHVFMQYLMAGYFLAFGLMQTISLKKSAKMLQQYDPLARKFAWYGYAYPLIQLGFGVAYFFWLSPLIVNALAMLFIAINTLGVIEVLVQKKEVRCGCLGKAINVPVSFVTLAENAVMLLMTTGMFIYFLAHFIPSTANAGDYTERGGHFHRSI